MGGLKAQNRIGRAIRGAVRSIYRVAIIKRGLDRGLGFLQAFGHGDPDDPDNQELVQEDNIDHAQYFGFTSHPPADTEAVILECDGGEVSVAERDSMENLDTFGNKPKEIPKLEKGDTCIYAQGGTHIYLDADGHLTIRCITGDIVLITETGLHTKIGSTANRALALDGDYCISNLAFDAWALAVEAGILAAAGPVVGPWGAAASLANVAGSCISGRGDQP